MAESRRSSVESLTSRQVAFAQYRFNPGTGELWRGDKEIKLTPRAATLLAALAERATLVVTKQELIARAWEGRAVGDDALTSCVQELRRALGDDPRQPQLIETRHRRGYRLLVPVSAADPMVKNDSAPEPAAPLPLPDEPSIAVLPFQNMSGDPEQEYFADGMVEEIITALSRVRSLFVIARNSSFTYKGKAVDIRQVGRELGVRYVLEGSVRKAGNRIRQGEVEKAIEHQQQCERLNPLGTQWGGNVAYAIAYFGVGDHEKVVDWTARILRERPNAAPAMRYRAASLALLGRAEEARQVVVRLLEHAPGYSISEVRRHHEFDMNSPFKKPGVTEALYRGLRLAGLPE